MSANQTPWTGATDDRPATTSHSGLMPKLGAASATLGGFTVTGKGRGSTINPSLATGSVAGAMPPQHFSLVGQLATDTGWQAASYAANWSDFGGGLYGAHYKRDPLGWVCLAGMAKKSVVLALPDTIFTLPAGYRPAAAKRFPGASGGGVFCQILINTTGTVQIETQAAGGTNAYVNLEGIRFDPAT